MAILDLSAPDPHSSSTNCRSDLKRSPRLPPYLSLPSLCCENSAAAFVDVLILLLVLSASVLLFSPYFKYLFAEAAEILPLALVFIGEVVYQAPIAYITATVLTFVSVIGGMEFYEYKCRKCSNPECRGLRKCAEFDIQLEYDANSSSTSSSSSSSRGMETTEHAIWKQDHKDLEAKLKKMAPPNGRAILVFRYPCGCPAAHMAVAGAKKPRKLLKR